VKDDKNVKQARLGNSPWSSSE